ncbi:hypothetical protein IH992_20595 [Candidatus Poribacteria bacterium]|nr:hypothetical protein [Candidatus Poribacteria bacterium]
MPGGIRWKQKTLLNRIRIMQQEYAQLTDDEAKETPEKIGSPPTNTTE